MDNAKLNEKERLVNNKSFQECLKRKSISD